MKKLFVICLITLVSACTTGSPQQFYRPAGATEQFTISGNFNQFSFEHNVMINGEKVVTGNLPYNYEDTLFTGQYGEMEVTSDCKWKSKTDLRCLVKIDGENAANLVF